jgi:hypothetical protein
MRAPKLRKARPFLGNPLSMRRKGRAYRRCEVEELLVTGQPLQIFVHQVAGAGHVATLMSQSRPQKHELWSAEGSVVGQPIEAIFRLGFRQLIQQQQMPFGKSRRPLLTCVRIRSPGALRLHRTIAGEPVERVKVVVGEADTRVEGRQHLRQETGQRDLLLVD